ncbi:inactive leucine-rich repeat receptor-like serine/threonine-protein kinase At1g60630 [Brachypodium distachyon]|uniref:inactive leucine-rich repeat receptor-like serine/threonine-protein kinase At1g60630 n=1 Tax=Brachypodium distachyon TaxID=15368 RepID=UPI00052FF795|nr:inactive leucine-rich repeat receptor-like serine/threonine-protein kinase At1g60630 [Brachypodium distachyon]|eukprot:XP_010233218.1 inactive leucine-rich repeat receptor-like serine/threonine-protein kinase At1g60630 [Brachypodium distachyon]
MAAPPAVQLPKHALMMIRDCMSRPSSKGKTLQCMKIVEDIAFGLLHLHQHSSAGIVHGNLKPSNVLLRPDCESSLTDYGLVPALLHSSPSASLLYRAPETRFASSAIGGFTAASDVYSFGVLLTGRTPFQELLQADDIPAWATAKVSTGRNI